MRIVLISFWKALVILSGLWIFAVLAIPLGISPLIIVEVFKGIFGPASASVPGIITVFALLVIVVDFVRENVLTDKSTETSLPETA